ncbi:MAG: MIP/aquaporin family protein [Janthinobacterium lividum]
MHDLAAADMRSAGSENPHAPKPSNALLIYSAEAIGTFMLVLVGTAVATAAALGKGTAGPAYNSLAVALSFGFILTPIVGALGPVSGAHVNPAVTLGLAVAGKFPWRLLSGYVIAQTVGAIVAALAVWAIYGRGAYVDSHLGAPSPVNDAGSMQVLLAEALIAFILVLTVLFTATDPRVPPGVAAIAIGFALVAGVFLGGPVSGGAGNPARAIGPMIVTGRFPVWFFYMAGPLVGGVVAAIVFRIIGRADAPTMSLDGLEGAPLDASQDTPVAERVAVRSGGVVRLAENVTEEVVGRGEHALDVAVQGLRRFGRDKPVAAVSSAMGLGTLIGVVLRRGLRR